MKIKRAQDIRHQIPEGKNHEYPYAQSDLLFETQQIFLSSEKVMPGCKASAPHIHKGIDEIAVVIQGELEAFEGEMHATLLAGDSILFKSGSEHKHFLENRSDKEAVFLLFRRNTQKDDTLY